MELRLRIQEFLFLRHLHHVPQRAHGPGNDGDLLHRLGILLQGGYQRVAHLMVGNDAPLLLAHDAVLLLLTHKHLLHGLEQILLADVISALLHRVDGGLVDHIGKIGADGAAGRERDGIQIHGFIHQDVLGMDLQNLHTSLQIRLIHDDLPVKTARTKQRLIQNLRPVGRAQNQNPPGAVETVHLT